jgi:RNA polymerase sigma factor (sigma-70 family)
MIGAVIFEGRLPEMADTNNLTSLYLSIRGSLARSLVGIVPPREIEDIVQEGYVRVCQAGKKRSIRGPKSYLFRTVRNLALDYVKRAESRLTDSLEDANVAETGQLGKDTFDQVASNEEFANFCDAVRHLPVQCRKAFVLKKVYGFSQREIARELGLSESTVEKHIALGIKRCAYFMEQFDQPQKRRRRRYQAIDTDEDRIISSGDSGS